MDNHNNKSEIDEDQMVERKVAQSNKHAPGINRMPEDSTFFENIIPALLIIMTVVTIGLLVYAVGIMFGAFSF